MYNPLLVKSFVVAFSLSISTLGQAAHLGRTIPRALSSDVGTLNPTLGTVGHWFWRKDGHTVEFLNFREPNIPFNAVGSFVTAVHTDLRSRRMALHKHETDDIGSSTTHPASYDYSSTQSHLFFGIEEDWEHIGELAYYVVDLVLQSILAFANHNKENRVPSCEFILWYDKRYIAHGDFGIPSVQGLLMNESSVVPYTRSLNLYPEEWNYSSGDYLVTLYDFHRPLLIGAKVSALVTAARDAVRIERGSQEPAALIHGGSFNYDYGGVSIEISGSRTQRLSFAGTDVVLRAVGAYATSCHNVPEFDIVVHRRGNEIAEGVLRQTPTFSTGDAVASQ